MQIRRIFSNALVMTLAALGFTACDSEKQEKYVAQLSAANEVPANASSASGRVVFIVSRDGSYAEYSEQVTGLSAGITGVHFHRAAAGVNGPIVLSAFFDDATGAARNSLVPGTSELEIKQDISRRVTKAQLDAIIADLRAGNIYANVHTSNRPGGEIRGQMVKQ